MKKGKLRRKTSQLNEIMADLALTTKLSNFWK